MNHCEYCEAKLGDFETIEELGVGFGVPLEQVRLLEIRESFSGSCGGCGVVIESSSYEPPKAGMARVQQFVVRILR